MEQDKEPMEQDKEEEESEESDLGMLFLIPLHRDPSFQQTSLLSDLDMEGTITPDEKGTQEMGDASVEVTEEMREKANEERTQGSIALADGMLACLNRRSWCCLTFCDASIQQVS